MWCVQLLNVPEAEVERLVVALILDERIAARIDQVQRVVLLASPSDAATAQRARLTAVGAWARGLSDLHAAALHKLH